jgi:hypothetical protein
MQIAPVHARLAVTLGAAVVLAATGLAIPATADAASHLNCTASASPKHPTHNSYVYISVHTRAHARVHTLAQYKTTSTGKSGKANGHGNVVISYDISDATSGYKVHVSVGVKIGSKSGSCSTSFTPRS